MSVEALQLDQHSTNGGRDTARDLAAQVLAIESRSA